jgi:hypothetical protein
MDNISNSALEKAVGVTASEFPDHEKENLHFVRRTEDVCNDYSEGITGYDAERMQARTALSYEQEKKLLRRVDWHVLPLLAIMYMLKSIDSSNVCINVQEMLIKHTDYRIRFLMRKSWTREHLGIFSRN